MNRRGWELFCGNYSFYFTLDSAVKPLVCPGKWDNSTHWSCTPPPWPELCVPRGENHSNQAIKEASWPGAKLAEFDLGWVLFFLPARLPFYGLLIGQYLVVARPFFLLPGFMWAHDPDLANQHASPGLRDCVQVGIWPSLDSVKLIQGSVVEILGRRNAFSIWFLSFEPIVATKIS